LQNNKPLFVGGGKKKKSSTTATDDLDYEHLAVPAGLVCMTQTVCRPVDSYANEMEDSYDIEDEREIVPEGLYERLLELAEVKEKRKMTKKKKEQKKNKTHKRK